MSFRKLESQDVAMASRLARQNCSSKFYAQALPVRELLHRYAGMLQHVGDECVSLPVCVWDWSIYVDNSIWGTFAMEFE